MRLLLLFVFLTTTLKAESFNIRDRISYQDLYLKIYREILSFHEINHEDTFKKIVSNLPVPDQEILRNEYRELSTFFPPLSLRAIIALRYFPNLKNQKKLEDILEYTLFNKIMVLRDKINFAHSEAEELKYLNQLRDLTELPSLAISTIYETLNPILKAKIKAIIEMQESETFITALKETKIVNSSLKNINQGYQLSHLGIISGNKVELLSENDTSLEMINWYNERAIFNGAILDPELPYMKMPLNQADDGHPAFKSPIFGKIRDMILAANESIFIDIFLMGGTLGGTLAEFLLDQTKEKLEQNPNFKVVILHDYATHYNMIEEMLPVFKYIDQRISTEDLSQNVFLLQANIQRHPPGIPFNLTQHIPKTQETFPALQKLSSYYESKIDHSKVIIVDGNTNSPKAYFGSKNWTDHSGGYYYDNALYIEGPAAALVQNSYYRDLEAALTTDQEELKWFYYQKEGLDNKKYLAKRDQILKSFKITIDEVPFKGKDSIRLAEADVDASIKNTRNIVIDMIKNSKKNIFMEQLFLYDKYIVDALIKKRIENKNIDIRIIVDNNYNFKLSGFPNTIFIKELNKYGIKVRTRNTLGSLATFKNGEEQMFHQENHRKIIVCDSERLLIGSSNLNPDTLQGSFRELGAEVFSTQIARDYELKFLATWADHETTLEMDIENFQIEVKGKKFSKDFSTLVNDIAAFLIRSKDRIEKKN